MKLAAPVITVDLEEWFHLLEIDGVEESRWGLLESRIEANTERLLTLFEEHGVHATFFSLGWIAGRYGALLRRIVKAGHHVGCHSNAHALVSQETPDQFRSETRRAMATIADAISKPVNCYRAPGFSITPNTLWAFDELLELGVKVDCSVLPGRHAHGGLGTGFPALPFKLELRGGSLRELPMSMANLGPLRLPTAGGGYFRLLPFFLMAHWADNAPYVMTYFHPRDFDEGQPRLPGLSRFRGFKAYVGIRGAYDKLDRFLGRFNGRSVAEADQQIAWGSVPTVKLVGE